MRKLEENGFTQREIASSAIERRKIEDLEFLKKKTSSGPFTSPLEIASYVDTVLESKKKDKRMYTEVRYQRNTSQSLGKDAAE